MRVVALPIVCQASWRRVGAVAILLAPVALAACARTGLYPGDLGESDGDEGDGGRPGVTTGSSGNGMLAVGGATLPLGGSAAEPRAGRSNAPDGPPVCQPSPEACNGRDDDCNGAVDELAPQACPGGGARLCVAGRWSDCPRRCDVCVPGSMRVCQNSFCTFWGEQQCAADGQGFGHCREANPPPECAGIAKKHQDSRELEQCCIDNGYCCLDEHDLDEDGNRNEVLGACRDVSCQ